MGIDELIKSYRGTGVREWIDHEGFDALYVRVCKRYINNEHIEVIDLANLSAKDPGNGAFKALVKYLRDKYPEFIIHVESVLTKRFSDGLLRMGFVPTHLPGCFYLPKV